MTGWDDPDTVRYYQAFDRRHMRYRAANRALIRHARILNGQRVLDFMAGAGGTAAFALAAAGPDGVIDCVEPAAAMRAAGQKKFDARVRWHADIASAGGGYDRIVCGAGLWQLPDLGAGIRDLAGRLAPGGALCFNVPAAYLGEADRPGGGRDPWLTELIAALTRFAPARTQAAAQPMALPSREDVSHLLRAAGLMPQCWHFNGRLTQAAWRDWLKIPVLTEPLLAGLSADERARRVDEAWREADPRSWRYERWLGWTAWRPPFITQPLEDATSLLNSGEALRTRALAEGYLYLPGLIERGDILRLRRKVLAACRAEGLAGAGARWLGQRFGDGSSMGMYTDPRWIRLQQQVFALPEFTALGRHAAVCGVLERVLGAALEMDQGSVCRLAPPVTAQGATPPHRDYQFIGRTTDLWTAWMPLGDCPLELGPLAVAAGSHRSDSTATPAWFASPMAAGDVLMFNTLTLHRACANVMEQRVRLSVDFRFAPRGRLA